MSRAHAMHVRHLVSIAFFLILCLPKYACAQYSEQIRNEYDRIKTTLGAQLRYSNEETARLQRIIVLKETQEIINYMTPALESRIQGDLSRERYSSLLNFCTDESVKKIQKVTTGNSISVDENGNFVYSDYSTLPDIDATEWTKKAFYSQRWHMGAGWTILQQSSDNQELYPTLDISSGNSMYFRIDYHLTWDLSRQERRWKFFTGLQYLSRTYALRSTQQMVAQSGDVLYTPIREEFSDVGVVLKNKFIQNNIEIPLGLSYTLKHYPKPLNIRFGTYLGSVFRSKNVIKYDNVFGKTSKDKIKGGFENHSNWYYGGFLEFGNNEWRVTAQTQFSNIWSIDPVETLPFSIGVMFSID